MSLLINMCILSELYIFVYLFLYMHTHMCVKAQLHIVWFHLCEVPKNILPSPIANQVHKNSHQQEEGIRLRELPVVLCAFGTELKGKQNKSALEKDLGMPSAFRMFNSFSPWNGCSLELSAVYCAGLCRWLLDGLGPEGSGRGMRVAWGAWGTWST